jgi:hypothetical protein
MSAGGSKSNYGFSDEADRRKSKLTLAGDGVHLICLPIVTIEFARGSGRGSTGESQRVAAGSQWDRLSGLHANLDLAI